MAHQYSLRVTAGPSYDPQTHEVVNVNSPIPIHISHPNFETTLNVRVQNYIGLPENSPESSPYFSHPLHTSDQYSLSFSFVSKDAINGNDLLFGNDFDHPIRDRLPPGFSTAFRFVKWWIDPGLEGDPYADEPYLYGPALSSLNVVRVGEKVESLAESGIRTNSGEEGSGTANAGNGESNAVQDGNGAVEVVIEEGGDGSGTTLREENNIPADAAARKKYFLDENNRKKFEIEAGRLHQADFFNPYLDFNEFALRLPGFTLPIIKHWDGQPLRYVLRHRETKQLFFCVLFSLIPKTELEDEEKDAVAEKAADDDDSSDDDGSDEDDEDDEGKEEKIAEGKEQRTAQPTGYNGADDDID